MIHVSHLDQQTVLVSTTGISRGVSFRAAGTVKQIRAILHSIPARIKGHERATMLREYCRVSGIKTY